MTADPASPSPSPRSSLRKAAPVIIVGSVMFSFISYWRVAAVVLCDLASTAFYIGGIVEQMIGPAAPWFILAVMCFSYAVRAVYIESCTLFVRGGVYRVVKSALGNFPAKLAVSALLFDYILTGPISSVSAGQYLGGLILESLSQFNPAMTIVDPTLRAGVRQFISVLIAIGITIYFFRKNLVGIHESSSKALRIMIFTTVVAVIALVWSGLTLAVKGPMNSVPFQPDLSQKVAYQPVQGTDRLTGEPREVWQRDPETGALVPLRNEKGEVVSRLNPVTGAPDDPLGFLPDVAPGFANQLRHPASIWTFFGVIGLIVAFGHSVLAMSGEETMAQVYREVESPKLPNFKKAAFIIFLYSVLFTCSVSFLAVLLIPDEIRMKDYADNLLGGLAMHVIGPPIARLILNALVVVAGFLILAGAVNTSIIGSNGVLNRVAEDGVLPDWFQRPHRRYGTTYRILYLIIGLQLVTIVVTRGDMILLGEAYAFGVLWSFMFNVLSMLVLRFKDPTPREFKVPLNVRIRGIELPIGLGLIVLVLAVSALMNLLTKEVATVSGLTFSAIFLVIFIISGRYTHRGETAFEHLEQFTEESTETVSQQTVGAQKPFRRLVAIRSPQNLYMLQKTLSETDPETTDVVVMTAKMTPPGGEAQDQVELDRYDRKLMTAVIELAEKQGKQIRPLVVPTNNPLYAVIKTAQELGAQELVVGASNKFTAEEQVDQLTFYWINLHGGDVEPLTIRLLGRDLDIRSDIGGGFRIPTMSERRARTVAELRQAGEGVERVLLAHDGTQHSSDLFDVVLTTIDPNVLLDIAKLPPPPGVAASVVDLIQEDRERGKNVGREMAVYTIEGDPGPAMVALAREKRYGLILLCPNWDRHVMTPLRLLDWMEYVRHHAPCATSILTLPAIPREVDESPPPPQAG